jgi:hypothetical protein
MKALCVIPATALLTALFVAGCSSPESSAAPSATPSAQSEMALYRRLAACLRTHGYPNLPDPIQDPRTGEVRLPPGTSEPPKSALAPCESIVAKLPKHEGPQHRAPTAAEIAGLRAFAACVRSHGLREFPDPDPNGDFKLTPGLMRLGKQGMRTQLEACRKERPSTLDRGGPGGMYAVEEGK